MIALVENRYLPVVGFEILPIALREPMYTPTLDRIDLSKQRVRAAWVI